MSPLNLSAITPARVCRALLLALAAATATAAEGGEESNADGLVVLEDFSDPLHVWRTFGDPHMGGTSDGSFTVDRYEGTGRFFGTIEQLPVRDRGGKGFGGGSGGSPGIGFFRTEAGALGDPSSFPDVRTCDGLRLTLRAEGNYPGFLLGFGNAKPSNAAGTFSRARGYRAALAVPPPADGAAYADVDVPFTAFTMAWDAGTGDAVATCADAAENCPDDATKADPRPVMVYAKGAAGAFDLRIRTIAAYGCDLEAAAAAGTGDGDGPDEIVVEDFSRPGGPINEWRTLGDPAKGGEGHSAVEILRGVAARFTGTAPLTMSTGKSGLFAKGKPAAFPDLSNCDGLQIEARCSTPYDGYYLSFGTDRAPPMRRGRGYKARVAGLPSGTGEGNRTTAKWAGSRPGDVEFGTVDLPFASFSSYWDEGTGTTVVPCSADDPGYCPSLVALKNIETLSLWGEGAGGAVALDVRRIAATGCRSGRYARSYLGAVDGGSGARRTFVLLAPGLAFAAAVLALAVAGRRWRERRRQAAMGPYGEVPELGAQAEVHVLRSELMEMRKVISALGGGAASALGRGGGGEAGGAEPRAIV